MIWQSYTAKEGIDIVKDLSSDLTSGLSSQQASERLTQYGPNNLDLKRATAWQIFWRQFKSPFIYLLLVAALLSAVLGQWIEAAMILLFLLINTLLGYFQESGSEKTVKLLADLISWKSRVWRDGQPQMIATADLVTGDIILLETGDKISADVRLLETNNFLVDESSLTGESIAILKQGERLLETPKEVSGAINLAFSGTTVVSGQAKAIIINTGARTVFGQIANLTTKTKRVSGFENNISRFSSFILKLILVTLIFVFVINLFLKGGSLNWVEILIFSIALAISVIPEALPLVMTFCFSKGARNLAKHKVVVKRLSAIEDLGGVEVLCSDKTGTLTENKLKVAELYQPEILSKKNLLPSQGQPSLLLAALLASSHQADRPEPFDLAIKQAAGDLLLDQISNFKVLFESPFDPRYLRNNVLVSQGEVLNFIVRGAPEVILDLVSNLNEADKQAVNDWLISQGKLGRRVLALASKELHDLDLTDFPNHFREEEHGLQFIGLVSFVDPIKASTRQAIFQAKELQVKIKIITGDSPQVAGAVGAQIGLADNFNQVITAREFEALEPLAQDQALEDFNIFARFTPDKKYELIKRLQTKYKVAYLGDGINDAPALKLANVSLAVNNAADIAREAADIILLENDLQVIVQGIMEGRQIFSNSAKFIKATLAGNFGNFYAVAIASLLIDFLPMLPLQILLLNLLSDFPMIAIATDNVDKDELISPRRYQFREVIIITMILGILSSIFDFVVFARFYKLSPEILQTNWFIASILTELAFLFSIRTQGFMFKRRRPSRVLLWLAGLAAVTTVVIPYTAIGQSLFKFITPDWRHLLWIFGVVVVYLACSEIVKLLYYRQGQLKSRDKEMSVVPLS